MNKETPFILRKLKPEDKEAFFAAYQDFGDEKNFRFVPRYTEGMEFQELLRILSGDEKGHNLPKGYVPSTFFFAFVGPKIVGGVMVRHRLNDFLRKLGGHIGYGVVPSERGKGYAKKMLKDALVYARLLGLCRVLVTCDEDNTPSRKVIENAGGEFEGFSEQAEGRPKKRLYWIQPSIQRVAIIGSSGSGKTTLGRRLSSLLELPFFDLDDFAWLPNWVERDRMQERQDVEKVVAQKMWIIAGNYSRHRDLIWKSADVILWIDPPLWTCLFRGFRRAARHIWYKLPLCNGNYDSLSRLLRLDNRSILYWILTTYKKRRTTYEKLLEKEKDISLPFHIRIQSSAELEKLLRKQNPSSKPG